MGPLLEDITDRLGIGLSINESDESPIFISSVYSRLTRSRSQLLEDVIRLETDNNEILLKLLSSYDHDQTIGKLVHMALIGEVFVGLAHDFRNVLSVIAPNLEALGELIENSAPEDKVRYSDAIGDMHTAVKIGSELCKRVQQLGSHKSEKPTREDVRELVESSIRMSKVVIYNQHEKGKNVVIENRIIEPLYADMVFSEVQMAVLNIFFNAIRHSGSLGREPKVVVDTYSVGDRIYISITNNGPPIPEEIRGSLFQKPLTSFCVHGYGLYIAAKNIATFDGKISFETDSDSTTFFISLPASQGPYKD